MLYIKLDDGMNLSVTVNEPIYRGDNLSRKITYLLPLIVGDIQLQTATVFLCYIRADGTADIVTLERGADKYKEAYFQYTIPVTCKLTKYPGEVCTWLQIYAGTPSNPAIAKSSTCMLYVQASKNMDACLCDHQLTAIYQMQQQMDTAMANMTAEMAQKADNLVFYPEDSTIQLTAGGQPIGDKVVVQTNTGIAIVDIVLTENGDMVLQLSDGSEKNIGKVVDESGTVYVPHISERKILTYTIEDKPDGVPEPVDLNPHDEWAAIDDSEIVSDYIWEQL